MSRKKRLFMKGTVLGAIFTLVLFVSDPLKAQEKIDYQGLPPGKGVELVLENCTVCHSADIILQNHMTRSEWDKTITWMREEQGMWELDKKDRTIILDYLAQAQGVGQNQVKGKSSQRKNSMYEFEYKPNPL